ncbi:MAG TPA: Hint domain-containing protein [Pseudohaliea sp.]|nr:Hint domain-containing protein [Pseudohaliea sp.]
MASRASYTCRVLPGESLRAVAGVNQGDAVGAADLLCPGDVYRLAAEAAPVDLAIADAGVGARAPGGAPVLRPGVAHRIAPGSATGVPGASLAPSARLTFLAPDGHSRDVMLIETEGAEGPETLLFPLGPMEPALDYVLAGVASPGEVRLAEIVPFAFAAGTRLTMGDGRLVEVERLGPGDVVLTRDRGRQPVRAVLARTERALGAHAPVVIQAGALGAAGDLILSQHQRLLVYQRGPDRLTQTAEMLVRAGDLVDGEAFRLRRGGFVDYVSIVLDRHEMLFAEGVAVESLEVNAATLPRLPEEQAAAVAGLDHAPHHGTEADRALAAAARARLLGDRE